MKRISFIDVCWKQIVRLYFWESRVNEDFTSDKRHRPRFGTGMRIIYSEGHSNKKGKYRAEEFSLSPVAGLKWPVSPLKRDEEKLGLEKIDSCGRLF
jgi:hypothetical protein